MRQSRARDRTVRVSLLGAILLGASGCKLISGEDSGCTLVSVAAIRLTVQDSVTGATVTEQGIRAFVHDDPLFGEDFTADLERLGTAFFGPYERPGNYTVTVVSPSYEPWIKAGIRVRANECHVIPVNLTARLRPRG